jgi:hypothetical protein
VEKRRNSANVLCLNCLKKDDEAVRDGQGCQEMVAIRRRTEYIRKKNTKEEARWERMQSTDYSS